MSTSVANKNNALDEANDYVIGELIKTDDVKKVFKYRVYQGHPYLDIRVNYKTNGSWWATKKGITFVDEELDDVIELLQQAKVYMQKVVDDQMAKGLSDKIARREKPITHDEQQDDNRKHTRTKDPGDPFDL